MGLEWATVGDKEILGIDGLHSSMALNVHTYLILAMDFIKFVLTYIYIYIYKFVLTYIYIYIFVNQQKCVNLQTYEIVLKFYETFPYFIFS